MSIHYKVRYKCYPHSERATKYSRLLGLFTAWPMLMIYAFCWWGGGGFLLESILADEGIAYGAATASLAGMLLLVRFIKKKVSGRIDRIALEDSIRKSIQKSMK